MRDVIRIFPYAFHNVEKGKRGRNENKIKVFWGQIVVYMDKL